MTVVGFSFFIFSLSFKPVFFYLFSVLLLCLFFFSFSKSLFLLLRFYFYLCLSVSIMYAFSVVLLSLYFFLRFSVCLFFSLRFSGLFVCFSFLTHFSHSFDVHPLQLSLLYLPFFWSFLIFIHSNHTFVSHLCHLHHAGGFIRYSVFLFKIFTFFFLFLTCRRILANHLSVSEPNRTFHLMYFCFFVKERFIQNFKMLYIDI